MTAKQKLESKIYALTQMFRTTPEIENDLWEGVKEYAREKCREQRISCRNAFYEQIKKDDGRDLAVAYGVIENAPEPNFD